MAVADGTEANAVDRGDLRFSPAGTTGDCAGCAALRQEIRRLQSEVAGLRADKEALLRSAANRDYERPPHYQ